MAGAAQFEPDFVPGGSLAIGSANAAIARGLEEVTGVLRDGEIPVLERLEHQRSERERARG